MYKHKQISWFASNDTGTCAAMTRLDNSSKEGYEINSSHMNEHGFMVIIMRKELEPEVSTRSDTRKLDPDL